MAVVVESPATLLILAWQIGGLPLLGVFALEPILSGHLYLFALVTLTTSSITATTALAKIFNLNDAMALSICVLGTLLMPVPLYVVIKFVLGMETSIDFYTYSGRIVLYIVVPFLLVWLMRIAFRKTMIDAVEQATPSVVLGLLMVFGLCVMDGVREMIHSEPMHLLKLVLLAFGMSLLIHLTTYFALRFLGECDVKTACLACAYRNMGVVAAVTDSTLGEYFLIFVGVWQLPMYILPYLFERFYRFDGSR